MTDSEIVSKLMGIVPHGYTPAHTRENLPGRVDDIVREVALQSLHIERLEAILEKNGITVPEMP